MKRVQQRRTVFTLLCSHCIQQQQRRNGDEDRHDEGLCIVHRREAARGTPCRGRRGGGLRRGRGVERALQVDLGDGERRVSSGADGEEDDVKDAPLSEDALVWKC